MYEQITEELSAANTRLVAVSKTKPNEAILEMFKKGQLDFGENKVQELVPKYESLPKEIRWHMIGHLQTNKVKYIAPFIHLIHSIDSFKILKEVNKQAKKNERVIDCLLQFKIAEEDTKYGLERSEAVDILESDTYHKMQHIRITGVMGMATFTDHTEQVRAEFRRLKTIFEQLQRQFFSGVPHFKEISMGMSDDYRIAVEEGSTMVRIGTLLFGERVYN